MPRGKRRIQPAVSDSARPPSKRIRNMAVQAACPPPPPQAPPARRQARSEDFSQKRCLSWFHEYTCPDEPDTLGPEAMEKFCEDIGVEPENVLMLVLAYKMGASQMGFFSKNEWIRGFSELQCDSLTKFKGKLETLKLLLNDPVGFKNVYRYAYDFAKESDQRSMDTGTAKVMLQLLLAKNWPLYSQFSQFLDQSKYKVINKDQWCNILEFSRTIQNDLSNYDIDGAWPVMLDEFVEWLRLYRLNNPTTETTTNNNNTCAIGDNISSS